TISAMVAMLAARRRAMRMPGKQQAGWRSRPRSTASSYPSAGDSVDTESIVYGCIKHLPFGTLAERRASCLHNRQAVMRLPQADAWPFLCREMFSVPGDDLMGGTYHTQVIHFGMSYRAVEYEWEHWISKFEALLRNMYWVNATV